MHDFQSSNPNVMFTTDCGRPVISHDQCYVVDAATATLHEISVIYAEVRARILSKILSVLRRRQESQK